MSLSSMALQLSKYPKFWNFEMFFLENFVEFRFSFVNMLSDFYSVIIVLTISYCTMCICVTLLTANKVR